MPWQKKEPMEQRIEFAIKALRTDNFRALCQEYGISTKTGYKWRERFYRYGQTGMSEQSRRPYSHAEQLAESVVCQIVRLKQAHPHWGPRKIRALYLRQHGQAASESSFKRVLERAGMTEPRRRRQPATQTGSWRSDRRGQSPNEVWTVDFKGWWYDAQGQRCEPLTVRDEYSRYVLELQRLPDARTQTVQARFERLFERHGLPAAIRSDNGSPFAQVRGVRGLSRLSAWWVALGIDLERGRPGHPQDNGGHERPHEALAMKCPGEIYRPSSNVYAGTPEDVEYPDMDRRKICAHGLMKWRGQRLFIGTSLAGWSVGLKPLPDGQWEVWFGRLLLGWLDPATESFQRADIRPLEAGQSQTNV